MNYGSNYFLDVLIIEDGNDRLSRNAGTELPLNAVQYPRRAQLSSRSRRKPEISHGSNLLP
jgi:hypothetical protein